jgi:(p)ppGpp synthase/HD superfamily hydrolase
MWSGAFQRLEPHSNTQSNITLAGAAALTALRVSSIRLEVGWLLYRAGAPDQVVAAGVLHDVLEKTAVSVAELRTSFGSPVANLVSAVSEDERIAGYGRRKTALRQQAAAAGPEALTIFTADKVSVSQYNVMLSRM